MRKSIFKAPVHGVTRNRESFTGNQMASRQISRVTCDQTKISSLDRNSNPHIDKKWSFRSPNGEQTLSPSSHAGPNELMHSIKSGGRKIEQRPSAITFGSSHNIAETVNSPFTFNINKSTESR